MNERVGTVTVVACLVAVLGTGCASTRRNSVLTTEPTPVALKYSESLTFSAELDVPELTRIRDQHEPREWVLFGLSLGKRGRHHAAGEIFEETARRFASRGKAFEVRCLAAAANEYKDAGDMEKFRDCLRQLRQTCDRFQILGAGRELSVLLALGDVASGKAGNREWYPREVKELIRERK